MNRLKYVLKPSIYFCVKKTSIKDIAAELHLSKATISWILSGQGEAKGFSKATIKRVKEYAESVNYRPNLLARSLSKGASNTIGLIIPFINDTFYAQLTQAIEQEAARNNFVLIVCTSEGNGDKENELIKILKSKQVDGIIIAPTQHSPKGIQQLIQEKYPFVLVDRYFPELQTNAVIVDNENCSLNITQFLIRKGCKKIAFLTSDTQLYVMQERQKGYLEALKQGGTQSADYSLIIEIDRNNYKTDTPQKMEQLFKQHPDVDGFFFATHYLAIEAIRYFINQNIEYKTSFHMGCFHETTALDVLAPTMCISRMQLDKIGVTATNLILENIRLGQDFICRKEIIENEFLPSYNA